MSNDPNLEIKIKTTADKRGLDQAERGLKNVRQAARRVEDTTRQVGTVGAKGLGDMQRAGSDASTMLIGLEQASQGGVRGMVGLTNATRGFIGMVRGAVASTGPIGLLVTVLGLAAGAMFGLTRRTKQARDELDNTADSAKKVDEALQLRKDAVDRVAVAIKAISTETRQALEDIKELQDAADQITDATAERDVAAVEANRELSEDEKASRKVEILREAEAKKFRGSQEARDKMVEALNKETTAIEDRAKEEARTARGLQTELLELKREREKLAREVTRTDSESSEARRLASASRLGVGLDNFRRELGRAPATPQEAEAARARLARHDEGISRTEKELAATIAAENEASQAADEVGARNKRQVGKIQRQRETATQVNRLQQEARSTIDTSAIREQQGKLRGEFERAVEANDPVRQGEIGEEMRKLQESLKQSSDASKENITKAADAVSTMADHVPEPIDPEPLQTSIIRFGDTVIKMQDENIIAINKLNEVVDRESLRLDLVQRQLKNMRPTK